MSCITGTGWGSKHNWKNKGTEQISDPRQRSTLYECQDCHINFRHYYHTTPDIFECMKIRGIPEECVKTQVVSEFRNISREDFEKQFPNVNTTTDLIIKWISVKDRLPESYEKVLIFIPAFPGISIGELREDFWFDDVIRFDHDNKVTHWMPLPEPPE